MSNTLITPTIIAREALMHIKNNNPFASLINVQFKKEFVKVGDTIRIRKPVQFIGWADEDISSYIRDVIEEYVELKVDKPYVVAFAFPGNEETLKVEDYSNRYIKPASIEIAQYMATTICGLYADVSAGVGTAGTDPSAYSNMAAAAKQLDNLAVPNDGQRHIVLNPNGFYSMSAGLTALYLEKLASKAYQEGTMPKVAGFTMPQMSQSIYSHTVAGTQTSVTVVATLTLNSTLNQIRMAGLDNNLVVGDQFTIAGVYETNPKTRRSTGNLKKFTVTAAVTAGGTDDTVTFAPRIIMSDDKGATGTPASQGPAHQNVNAYPVVSAAITFTASHAANLAFHKDAFALVNVPIKMPDDPVWGTRLDEDGYSIRVTKQWDIKTNKEVCRLDVLFGVKTIRESFATRIYGAVS